MSCLIHHVLGQDHEKMNHGNSNSVVVREQKVMTLIL